MFLHDRYDTLLALTVNIEQFDFWIGDNDIPDEVEALMRNLRKAWMVGEFVYFSAHLASQLLLPLSLPCSTG